MHNRCKLDVFIVTQYDYYVIQDETKEREAIPMRNEEAIKFGAKEGFRYNIRSLSLTALFITLTYLFTAFVNIRLPIGGNGGLIHLGNVPLFIAAILFGKKIGALAGSFGMATFDLLSGWTLWAPFTFVIVGFMGYTTGAITQKHHGFGWNLLAMGCATGIKIVGYYVAEGIIYGNWIAPVFSIPGNLLQVGTAIIIVLLCIEQLRKITNRIFT